MATLISVIGFLGFIGFSLAAAYHVIRKTGQAKKLATYAGASLVLFIIGAAMSPSAKERAERGFEEGVQQAASTEPTQQAAKTPRKSPTKSRKPAREHFDRSNWTDLVSNPSAHKGATVEVVGKVFIDPRKDASETRWQMYADPRNNEWNTVVSFRTHDFKIKRGDYVRVKGTVKGEYRGLNAFGATLTVPMVEAESATVVNATEASSPPIHVVTPDANKSQHGITITLHKVEFAKDETRLHLTVANGTQDKVSFYPFNAKLIQGDRQFEVDNMFTSDYPQVQSELLPGVKSSGILSFQAMDHTQPTKIHLEARSDNFRLDFKPFVFDIKPDQ